MDDNSYSLNNVMANTLSDIHDYLSLVEFFNKYPKLHTLRVAGEAFVDDNDICYTLDFLKVNGRKYKVDWDEMKTPTILKGCRINELIDTCRDLLVIISNGSPLEYAEVEITREQLQKMQPLIFALKAFYDQVTPPKSP